MWTKIFTMVASTDRLSTKICSLLFLFVSLISAFKVFFLNNINCWTPDQFTRAHAEYTNEICWSFQTFLLPLKTSDSTLLDNPREYFNHHWFPLLLALQALLFYLPGRLWQLVDSKCGLSLRDVISSCGSSLEWAVQGLERWTSTSESKSRLVRKYLLYKVVVILNLVLNLIVMTTFYLSTHPLDNLYRLLQHQQVQPDPFLPTLFLCDFNIRQLEIIYNYTVQCSLPISTFYQVLFTCLWLWLLCVLLCCLCSFVYWSVLLLTPSIHLNFVKQALREDNADLGTWVRQGLGPDGVLTLRLVSSNCNQLLASQILQRLWLRHSHLHPTLDHYFQAANAPSLKSVNSADPK